MNSEDQTLIVTYEQLKEKSREKQGGLTLAEYVQQSELKQE